MYKFFGGRLLLSFQKTLEWWRRLDSKRAAKRGSNHLHVAKHLERANKAIETMKATHWTLAWHKSGTKFIDSSTLPECHLGACASGAY
jgi:hypothetical protein